MSRLFNLKVNHRFLRDKAFLRLKEEWYGKLAASGFKDIENKRGKLKDHDRRTIAFDNRELIAQFFTDLIHYIHEHDEIPELERQILILYSEGVHLKRIKVITRTYYKKVYLVIKKYREIILDQSRD